MFINLPWQPWLVREKEILGLDESLLHEMEMCSIFTIISYYSHMPSDTHTHTHTHTDTQACIHTNSQSIDCFQIKINLFLQLASAAL